MNANNLGIKNIMMIWTLLIVVGIAINLHFRIGLCDHHDADELPLTLAQTLLRCARAGNSSSRAQRVFTASNSCTIP